jgi:hypothetical protein
LRALIAYSHNVIDSFWHPAENGATIGKPGSEQGVTLRDEEHNLGARITLERDTRAAPFAIACGIYGWMVHTRFFASADEAELQYNLMKSAIGGLLDGASATVEVDGGRQVLMDGVSRFVETFP